MTAPTSSFLDLMNRLQAGEQDAATEIFDRYVQQLIGLARKRLDQATKQRVDPEDVVLSALHSFFVRKDRFQLVGWDSLWGLLARITLCKCCRHMEHVHAQRRSPWKEVHMPGSDCHQSWHAIARDPTPHEALVLGETLDRILAQLDEREQHILNLSLQGVSVTQISQAVGRTERTVRRVLERVRKLLELMRDELESDAPRAPRSDHAP